MLTAILKYYSFTMERNVALALVKPWVSRKKAFRLGERLVPFLVFDVPLLTSLHAVGEQVNFDEDNATTEFRNLIRERVHEVEQQVLRSRKLRDGKKDNSVHKNFIFAMVYLCESNGGEEQLEL